MGSKWDDQPLGTVPDAVIARTTGVSRERVRQVRSARGIPRYQKISDRIWDKVGLGTRPDHTIASELGVGGTAVRLMRIRKNIPSFGSGALQEARLRLDDVDVREMHNEGHSVNAIADMANVSTPRVRKELGRLGLHRTRAEAAVTDASRARMRAPRGRYRSRK